MGRHAEALAPREKALAKRRNLRGNEHSDPVPATQNVFWTFDASDMEDKVKELMDITLPLQIRVLGADRNGTKTLQECSERMGPRVGN